MAVNFSGRKQKNYLSLKNLFQEDKKLIRYREGKIVSTKGERFTQVTKEESLEMKRTIVNIQSV